LMFDDGTNIGIGTLTPSGTLHVVGEDAVVIQTDASTGTALTVYGTIANSTAVSIEGTMILSGGGVDFGDARYLTIPSSTSLTMDGTGQMYLETDQDGIVLHAGSGVAGQIPVGTNVQMPLIFQKSITILEPDQVQSVTGTVAFFTVDSFNYPNGIMVTAIRVLTSAASTDVIEIQFWDDPRSANANKTTIESIDIDTCTNDVDCRITAPSGTTTVPAERFIMVVLDDAPTSLEWMQITVWYYVPD
jgi:hypothetical protein